MTQKLKRCFRCSRLFLFVIFLACMAGSLSAQDTDSVQKKTPWYETIAMNGFASASYSYNFNVPDSRRNQVRVFDTDDNSFKMDVIELSLQKLATAAGEVGFCFHLTAGSSVPKVARSSGLNSGDLDFHQMYIRYIAKIGRGLTVDVGKFVTPFGYELIEGYDGYNDNFTRSFLFGYAIPFTHTGARFAYPFSDNITGTVLIVNGWDNSIDNNRSKSVAAQIAVTPVQGMTLFANWVTGPEQNNNDSDLRTVVDFSGSYAFSDQFTLGLNADYGTERNAALNGGTAQWNGAAVYLRFNASKHVSLTLRGEQFEDRGGARTGIAQKLREFTLTPECRPADGLVLRGDLRLDTSNENVFEKQGSTADTQFTVCANVLFIF